MREHKRSGKKVHRSLVQGHERPKGENEKPAFGEEWINMISYNEVPSGKDLCENLNIYL